MASQAQLYGELRSTEQQYRKDISTLPMPSEEEECALVQQARAGDRQARWTLIESCLPYVEYWASYHFHHYHWLSHRIEYEELLGTGNETLVKCLDRALGKEKPLHYLKRAARGAMMAACFQLRSLIHTPTAGRSSTPDMIVESLDVPLDKEGTLFADVLEAPTSTQQEERSFEPVYQAIEVLTDYQRDVLQQRYGLGEYAGEPVSLATIASRRGGVSSNAVESTRKLACQKLRLLMPSPQEYREVYTLAQVCQRLVLPKKAVENLLARHQVKPSIHKTGLYPKEQVEALAQKRGLGTESRPGSASTNEREKVYS